MSKRFNLKSLPEDVKEKIHSLDFNVDEDDNVMGFVNLKDEYVFEWDNSHIEGFTDKEDLIDIVRINTIRI